MNVLNTNAENIIKNNIRRFGLDVEFKKPKLNTFQEPTGEEEFETTLIQQCIYHTVSDYTADEAIQSDAGKTHSYKSQALLTEYNAKIKEENYCVVSGKLYRIFSINNYQQCDKFIDISIEEVRRESNTRVGENEEES